MYFKNLNILIFKKFNILIKYNNEYNEANI